MQARDVFYIQHSAGMVKTLVPDDGRASFHRNVCIHSQVYAVQQPRAPTTV